MMEAFEIGVSIALSDDLSAGVARAQQEIARLHKAVSTSGLAIEALRGTALRTASAGGLSQSRPRIGERIEAVSRPEAAVANIRKPDANASAPADKELSTNPGDSSSWPLDLAPAQSRKSLRDHDQAAVAADWQEFDHNETPGLADRLISDRPGLAAFGPDVTRPSTQSTPDILSDTKRDLLADSKAFGAAELAKPVSAPLSLTPETSVHIAEPTPRAAPVDGPALQHHGLTGADRQMPSFAGLDLLAMAGPSPLIGSAVPDLAANAAPVSAASPAESAICLPDGPAGANSRDRQRADQDAWHRQDAAGQQSLMSAHLLFPSAPPGAESEAEGQPSPRQSEGDVFLDGILVGRWISRFLRRESERANNGPNGFNPRRSQLLPGVTVG